MDEDRKKRKWDQGKLKYNLILPGFLEQMAEILTKGEVNHPRDPDGTPSWQAVEPEAYVNSLMRHLEDYRKGKLVDKEMLTHAMGHVAVNAMFLWWFTREKYEKERMMDQMNPTVDQVNPTVAEVMDKFIKGSW